MCKQSPFLMRGKPPIKLSKREGGRGWEAGVKGSQFLEGGCWERGAELFLGGLHFLHKNKLKSEIFNYKSL